MSTVIYGIKNCDTCRKALKALEGADLRDVRAAPLTNAERAEFIGAFGDAILNRASTTWRALDEAERARPVAELLAEHPTLMKRPVIRVDDALHLGWKANVRRALGVA